MVCISITRRLTGKLAVGQIFRVQPFVMPNFFIHNRLDKIYHRINIAPIKRNPAPIPRVIVMG